MKEKTNTFDDVEVKIENGGATVYKRYKGGFGTEEIRTDNPTCFIIHYGYYDGEGFGNFVPDGPTLFGL